MTRHDIILKWTAYRVGASSISLISACGESSLISLPLLPPQSLKTGFAGTP